MNLIGLKKQRVHAYLKKMRKKKKREPKLILTDEVRFQPVLNKNNEIIEEEIEKNLAGKYLLPANQWRNGFNKISDRIRFFWKLWRHCETIWRNQKKEIIVFWCWKFIKRDKKIIRNKRSW